MKRYCFISAMIIAMSCPASIVNKRVTFVCKGASEVYIVWGINGWQLPPDSLRPAGSFIRENLVYSTMHRQSDGQFYVLIPGENGTLLDFVFWITKGPFDKPSDAWDLNAPHKDYHAIISPGTVAEIRSHIIVRPNEPLTVLDFSGRLITISFLFLIGTLFFTRGAKKKAPGAPLLMIGVSVSLLLILMLIRPSVLNISWELFLDPSVYLAQAFWGSSGDVLFISLLTLFFITLWFLVSKWRAMTIAVTSIYCIVAVGVVAAAILNVRVVQFLGKPFTYQWLYYADFLQTPDAHAAIMEHIDPALFRNASVVMLATATIALSIYILVARTAGMRTIKFAGMFTSLSIAVFLLAAPSKIKEYKLSEPLIANPVTAFVASLEMFAETPELFTMTIPDSLRFTEKAERNSHLRLPGVNNILVVVLESVPSEFIAANNSRYDVTPNISRLAKNGFVFENVYAHAPATNLSMVTMLNSVYPWLSYNSLTQEHPDLPVPSVASELRSHGYRTGFFNSADNRYQNAEKYLKHRRFQRISDCRDISCDKETYQVTNTDWEFMSGRDDGCTATAVYDWIRQGNRTPFFAMMWTYQTHYPYFYSQKQRVYEPADTSLNKYLNALHYGDSIIGVLAENLRKSGLDSSTLLVVVGDHGEAFGRHGQISHGRMIYDENLHVPCIISNPGIHSSARYKGVGGLVDLAPTIMELIGFDIPAEWEGESLFAKTDESRVFFFAPWSDFLFGFREGQHKYIFNATTNKAEFYDLVKDPFETINLAAHIDDIHVRHARLAGWVQHVHRRTGQLLKKEAVQFAGR